MILTGTGSGVGPVKPGDLIETWMLQGEDQLL